MSQVIKTEYSAHSALIATPVVTTLLFSYTLGIFNYTGEILGDHYVSSHAFLVL